MPPDHGTLSRIDTFLAHQALATPRLIIDLETVRHRYRALREALPQARVYYAVKANPTVPVLAALAAEGANFDLASSGEIARCLDLGIAPDRVCFGNTIKSEATIAAAHAQGIGLYAFDCAAELDKIARAAPGQRVFCRIAVHGGKAEWPLSRKFGCAPAMATDLLLRARTIGLRPVGLSFHVGSQQTEPEAWTHAIDHAATVFRACASQGLTLDMLNLGGGLPARYRAPIPALSRYSDTIQAALRAKFGASQPDLMIEPGRHLTGDAGLLRSTVLLISHRGGRDARRWVYLDAGRYNGLAETQNEAIHYPIRTPRDGGPAERVVLAGPTCDSTDVIYDRTPTPLPLDLRIGDNVDFLTAGAYTASYASVEFNGFPPIQTHCI